MEKNNTVPFKKEGPVAKQIVIPYSKGNKEAKKPLPQNVFLTVGPLPINAVAACISLIEEQKWTVREVLFAGHVSQSPIALQQPMAVPVYHVIICKVFNEGEELIHPNLNLGPVTSGK